MKKILAIIPILLYCSQPKESSNTVILNYNEKLLSIEKELIGDSLTFQVPMGWDLADANFTSLIDSTIYQNDNSVNKIFQDANSESFLVYLENLPYQLGQDSTDLENGKWLALQYSDFAYNDLWFDQTVLQNESIVMFKVNIKKSINSISRSSLHFFIPRNKISSQALVVESTIASVKK